MVEEEVYMQEPELKNEVNALNTFIENIQEKHDVLFEDIIEQLNKIRQEKDQILIPSSILKERKLGILEAITKYLKENLNLKYHQIAKQLKRDQRVVWITYNKAKNKKKQKFIVKKEPIWLPISIFTNKNYGPLESVVHYLKDKQNLSLNEIAKLLDRDNRTVWSVYNKKGGNYGK